MTATDELRRLLDERGVEYTVVPEDAYTREYIKIGNIEILTNDRDEVAVYYLTPEQAVEATLGSDLKAENAKLRELVRHLYVCMEHYEANGSISCESCPFDNDTQDCDFERRMAELGMEVDA